MYLSSFFSRPTKQSTDPHSWFIDSFVNFIYKIVSPILKSTTQNKQFSNNNENKINKNIQAPTTEDYSDNINIKTPNLIDYSNNINIQTPTITEISNNKNNKSPTIDENRNNINIQKLTISDNSKNINNQTPIITEISKKENNGLPTIDENSKNLNIQQTTIAKNSDEKNYYNQAPISVDISNGNCFKTIKKRNFEKEIKVLEIKQSNFIISNKKQLLKKQRTKQPSTILSILKKGKIQKNCETTTKGEGNEWYLTPITIILNQLISRNENYYNNNSSFLTISEVTIQHLISTIFSNSETFSKEAFIIMLIYIDRIYKNSNFIINRFNVHKIIITSILIANKYLEDSIYLYFNKHYSNVSGFSCKEINNLERHFLNLISFDLSANKEDYLEYYNYLNLYNEKLEVKKEELPHPFLIIKKKEIIKKQKQNKIKMNK